MLEAIYNLDVHVIILLMIICIDLYISTQIDKSFSTVKAMKKMINLIYVAIFLTITSIACFHLEKYNIRFHIQSVIFILETLVIYYMFTFSYYHVTNSKEMPHKLKVTLLIPTAIVSIFIIINYFNPLFFKLNDNGYLQGGSLYLVIVFYKLFYMIYAFITLSKSYEKLSSLQKLAFYITIAINNIILLIQFINIEYMYTWILLACNVSMSYLFYSETYINKDSLTGFLNMKALEKILKNYEKEEECEYTLILIDLDNIKTIYDRGTIEADSLIRKFANTLKKALKKHKDCIFTRHEGDKFFIFTKKTDTKEIEEMLLILESNIKSENMQGSTGTSISYTYVYDVYKTNTHESYVDLIRSLIYNLILKKEEERSQDKIDELEKILQ